MTISVENWPEWYKFFAEENVSKVQSRYVTKLLKNRSFMARLKRPVQVNWDYDIPYLAGYSKDGRTVYFDRHFQPILKWRGKKFDTSDFIVVHEVGDKALEDLFRLRYQAANHVITHLERDVVTSSGLSWKVYDKFLNPQIKGIMHEKLKKVPKDLDLKPYKDEHERGILRALISGKDIRKFHRKVSIHRRRH